MTDFERDLHDRLHAARLPDAPPTLVQALDAIVQTPEPARHRGSRPLALLMVAAVLAGSGSLPRLERLTPSPPTTGQRRADRQSAWRHPRRHPRRAPRHRSRPGSMGSISTRCPTAIGSSCRRPRGRNDRAPRLLVVPRRPAQLRRPRLDAGRARDLLSRRGIRHHRANEPAVILTKESRLVPATGPSSPRGPERGLGPATRIAPARERPALPAGPDHRRRPPGRRARRGVPTRATVGSAAIGS